MVKLHNGKRIKAKHSQEYQTRITLPLKWEKTLMA